MNFAWGLWAAAIFTMVMAGVFDVTFDSAYYPTVADQTQNFLLMAIFFAVIK